MAAAIGDNRFMKLIFSPGAVKALTKLPRKEANGLLEKLKEVAAAPMGQYLCCLLYTSRRG